MTPRRPKVPRAPRGPLTVVDGDTATVSDVLWRVHRTSGPNVLGFNQLRRYGPLAHMRYDPHPPGPPAVHAGFGVTYAALDLTTALAEVFAASRLIDVTTGAPHATAWTPTRPLELLDLVGSQWALRNGAAAALTAANRRVCRAWAHAIHTELRSLDGLLPPSTMTGRPIVVLWEPSADAFPANPAFSRPLANPMVWTLVKNSALEIGYGITG